MLCDQPNFLCCILWIQEIHRSYLPLFPWSCRFENHFGKFGAMKTTVRPFVCRQFCAVWRGGSLDERRQITNFGGLRSSLRKQVLKSYKTLYFGWTVKLSCGSFYLGKILQLTLQLTALQLTLETLIWIRFAWIRYWFRAKYLSKVFHMFTFRLNWYLTSICFFKNLIAVVAFLPQTSQNPPFQTWGFCTPAPLWTKPLTYTR